MQKIKSFTLSHKILSLIILLALISLVYFVFFKNSTNTSTKYLTAKIEKGDIIVSVTGSGQVEASDSIDINVRASGDVTSIAVKVGQEVKKGALIATIDSRDAKIALENAQISLAKLKKPDTLSVLQKENTLKKTYGDSWNNVASFIIDTDSIMADIENLYDGYLGSKNKTLISKIGKEKIELSEKSYWEAKASLDSTTKLYKSLSRNSSNEEIKNLVNESLDTSKKISNTVKLSQASFDYVTNYLDDSNSTDTISVKNDLTSWASTANGYVNSLLSNLNSINEDTQSLNDTVAGTDELDIRQSELNLGTKQNAYNDYFIRAPFDGIISSLTAKVGQSASGSIGTLITKQNIVTIPLNEVDIAKIKLNQKASLTFDAISDLKVEGEVIEIDSSGTVSSGVVTYNVKIGFSSSDDRIKPGMSVSASIVTANKTQILVVPSSAVKTRNDISYVEVVDNSTIVDSLSQIPGTTVTAKQEIEIGISDDTTTEIVAGLKEGDIIVIKTITGSNSSSSSKKTPSILSSVSSKSTPGSGTGGGSGAGMIPRD